MNSPIYIASAVNKNYLPHAATLFASLIESNSSEALHLYLFCDQDISEEDKHSLRSFVASSGNSIEFLDISRQQIPKDVPISKRFSAAAWFRVLLPELLPHRAKVIYLDVDVLVLRSIRNLWETDLHQKPIGAVVNPLYPLMSLEPILKLGLESPSQYFNSGVLLMDLEQLRSIKLSQSVFSLAASDPTITRYADQEPLNAALVGKVEFLSPKWNAQNSFFDLKKSQLLKQGLLSKDIDLALHSPAIIHFSGPWKPWHQCCDHPHTSLYSRFRAKTPWPEFTPLRAGTIPDFLVPIFGSAVTIFVLEAKRRLTLMLRSIF